MSDDNPWAGFLQTTPPEEVTTPDPDEGFHGYELIITGATLEVTNRQAPGTIEKVDP